MVDYRDNDDDCLLCEDLNEENADLKDEIRRLKAPEEDDPGPSLAEKTGWRLTKHGRVAVVGLPVMAFVGWYLHPSNAELYEAYLTGTRKYLIESRSAYFIVSLVVFLFAGYLTKGFSSFGWLKKLFIEPV